MPRPVWSGAVSFGLVTIPVKMLPASSDHSIRFHQVHREDGGRVRNRKICEIDGKVLDNSEIGKGFEVARDRIVPLTDEDFEDLPLPTAKAIEIVAFVDADEIDPIQMGAGYYLEGDGQVAAKPYTLLRKALERSAKVALAKYAFSGKERLAMLRVLDRVIVLQVLHWPDEVRDGSGLPPKPAEVTDQEIEQAVSLMDTMHREDLDDFHDAYRAAVEELIVARSEGREPPHEEPEEPEKGQVVDLMAALQDSVRTARESRGEPEPGGDATVHDLRGRTARRAGTKESTTQKPATQKPTAQKPAARKSPGKKAPAKKSAPAKKTAAKKTTAKKSAAKKSAPRSGGRKKPA
ncbi:Ku protein [Streptomyces sp. NPDC007088]|uniref:non-homologous end joining protein Ku n=1 Tax=Streptomyces sp. NPDC007088 TaxID=3364773 RepID=UPI0036BA5CF2